MANDAQQVFVIQGDGGEFDEQVERNAKHLSARRMAGAGRRAINRAARTFQTHYSRGVRDRLALPARHVKDEMDLTRATDANLEARITVSRQPQPLKEYGAKQRNKGVSVRVTKDTGRTIIPSSFTVDMFGLNIFLREGDERLPIEMLWGPSIGSQEQTALARARPEAQRVLEERLNHEIGRQIEQANR